MEDKQLQRLIILAQTGDRRALNELFVLIQKPIFHYIFNVVNDTHSAEDLLQEVFIVIFRKLWLLQEPKAFFTWVYRIASRLSFRYLKKHKKILFNNEMLDREVDKYSPDDLLDLDIDIKQLISQVSATCRALIFLRFLEEKSLKEIAMILEIPVGTVKSRLNSGISQLRKMSKT